MGLAEPNGKVRMSGTAPGEGRRALRQGTEAGHAKRAGVPCRKAAFPLTAPLKKSEVRRTSYPRGISPNNQEVDENLKGSQKDRRLAFVHCRMQAACLFLMSLECGVPSKLRASERAISSYEISSSDFLSEPARGFSVLAIGGG